MWQSFKFIIVKNLLNLLNIYKKVILHVNIVKEYEKSTLIHFVTSHNSFVCSSFWVFFISSFLFLHFSISLSFSLYVCLYSKVLHQNFYKSVFRKDVDIFLEFLGKKFNVQWEKWVLLSKWCINVIRLLLAFEFLLDDIGRLALKYWQSQGKLVKTKKLKRNIL